MRDLDDVVRRSLDERAERLAGATPNPGALAATIAGVRRRRRRRAAGEAFAGVAVAASLVVATAFGGQHGRPAPAITPSPTTSTAPSPTATPAPTPVATPAPGPTSAPTSDGRPARAQVEAGLGLPATTAPPADVWRRVGEGWVLGIYRPSWQSGDRSTFVRNTVVLASPGGQAYRLRELPANRDVELVRWAPGATRALVTIAAVRDGVTGRAVRGWLDLRTGRLTDDPGAVGRDDATGYPPDIRYLGVDHRGNELWVVTYGLTGGGGPAELVVQRQDGTLVRRIPFAGDDPAWGSALVDPTGRVLALPGDPDGLGFEVVDLDSGREHTQPYGVPGRFCQVVGWRSAAELLARCRHESWESTGFASHVQSVGDVLEVVSLTGGAPRAVRTLRAGDPAVPRWAGVTLPGRLVVVGAPLVGNEDDGSCDVGLYSLGEGPATTLGVRHVAAAVPVARAGSRLYSVTETACGGGDQRGVQLESLVGTTRTPLLRPPASTDPHLFGGLETWVVAGGPSGHEWG